MNKSSDHYVYKKILPGGTLNDQPLSQQDYDLTVQYIRKCFPKATKLQNVDETLKRTFRLEEPEIIRKRLSKKRKHKIAKIGSNRKQRLKKERSVPRKLNYEPFKHLNELWKSYVSDLLRDEERQDEIQQRLNRIDFHGSYLRVIEANCKDFVGLEGIVVKEAKNSFIVVSPSGNTKTIPKAENVFAAVLQEPQGNLRICGNSFLTRPAERSSKKMKSFMESIGTRVYKSRLRFTHPK